MKNQENFAKNQENFAKNQENFAKNQENFAKNQENFVKLARKYLQDIHESFGELCPALFAVHEALETGDRPALENKAGHH